MRLDIDFEWVRFEGGFGIADKQFGGFIDATNSSKSSTLSTTSFPASGVALPALHAISQEKRDERIALGRGKVGKYRPLQQFGDELYRDFVLEAKSPEGALSYLTKYGPLTADGKNPIIGEKIGDVIEHAKAMQRISDAYINSDAAKVEKFIREGLRFGIRDVGRIDVHLVYDWARKGPKLVLSVPDLLTAIWLQFGQAISNQNPIAKCLDCGRIFEHGPGTARRAGAKFCSDKHRISYNSRMRS